METVKKGLSRWLEPAVIVAIMWVLINSVKSDISSVKTELTLFREEMNRMQSRQDAEIRSTDKKIDDLKNSIISRK